MGRGRTAGGATGRGRSACALRRVERLRCAALSGLPGRCGTVRRGSLGRGPSGHGLVPGTVEGSRGFVTTLRGVFREPQPLSTVVRVGRDRRTNLAGGLYHVGAEGNDGRAIVVDRADCARWTSLLETVQERHGWIVHVHCLMTTHFHVLVDTPSANLSDAMHWLNHVYAKTFNRRHNRRHHLFGKRFWDDVILSDSQLVAVTRYIALNPVKAGLCARPQDWPWSNYGQLYPVAMGMAVVPPRSVRELVAQGARLAAQKTAA